MKFPDPSQLKACQPATATPFTATGQWPDASEKYLVIEQSSNRPSARSNGLAVGLSKK
jgi:hypothetical protein